MNSPRPQLPFVYKLTVSIAVLAGLFAVAMVLGAADTTIAEVWQALALHATGDNMSIIRDIRFPREAAAMAVGSALAVAGAVMQGMTRNPLADPGLLGITAGANAVLAVALAVFPAMSNLGIMTACFAGAALGAAIVFGIASLKRGGFSPLRVVLAGAAVSAFLYAVAEGIGLYFHISQDVSMWTAGGLSGTSWKQLYAIVPFIAGGVLVALLLGRQLTVLSLNEDVAVGLGQKIMRIKAGLFAVVIVLAGASVAIAGNMTFVGLMVPHVARAFVGRDYRVIVPISAIAGAAWMLAADTVGRTLHAPFETPVSAIVALMGLPFFLLLVHRGGKAFS